MVLVVFLFTSDYLNSCFCRLFYWETTTDLEGSTFPRLNDSVAFFRVKYSFSHFWSSLCICFLPNIFLSKMEILSLESLHQNKKPIKIWLSRLGYDCLDINSAFYQVIITFSSLTKITSLNHPFLQVYNKSTCFMVF